MEMGKPITEIRSFCRRQASVCREERREEEIAETPFWESVQDGNLYSEDGKPKERM